MTTLREAAQQTLEAWDGGDTEWFKRAYTVMEALRAALADPVLQTCNCRWDGEMQMQQCTLHEAHVDAIKEWAQRAKFAEKKLAALAESVQDGKCKHCVDSCPACDARKLPVQEPVALDWLHKWANQDDGEPETQWHEGYEAARRVVQIHLTASPQRKPLTVMELQDALVNTNLIDPDAVNDPEGYDEGSTLAQIDELHRRLTT